MTNKQRNQNTMHTYLHVFLKASNLDLMQREKEKNAFQEKYYNSNVAANYKEFNFIFLILLIFVLCSYKEKAKYYKIIFLSLIHI